jgi:hypothetical protein
MDDHQIQAIDLIQRFGLPRKGSAQIVAAMNEGQIANVLACDVEGAEQLQVYEALCTILAAIHDEEPLGWQMNDDEVASREDAIDALVEERKAARQSASAPDG